MKASSPDRTLNALAGVLATVCIDPNCLPFGNEESSMT
jgi:hypothetical protein